MLSLPNMLCAVSPNLFNSLKLVLLALTVGMTVSAQLRANPGDRIPALATQPVGIAILAHSF